MLDFSPLLDRIGDARVVMLGEASHGTHQYYEIRAALTRRLIAELGFSFVAVEGDWPDCERINQAVTTGGDSLEALLAFRRWPTWMWANEEVAEFARWLRDFNAGGADKAGFHGLDVYSLWESLDAIAEYVREHEPEGLEAIWQAYQCFEPFGREPQEYAFVSEGCEPEVVRLLVQAIEHGSLDVVQNAAVVRGAERYYRAMIRGGGQSWNIRDRHMTDTLDRLLEHYGPQSKAVVWAHNTHVGDARATDMARSGMVNIGQLGRDRYGRDNVVLVGFGSHRGEVVAAQRWGAPFEIMRVPPARPGSLEDLLHTRLKETELLVFPTSRAPMHDTVDHRAIGVVYHPEVESWGNYVPTVLGERYDAFIWCDETGPVRPLHAEAARGEFETYPTGV